MQGNPAWTYLQLQLRQWGAGNVYLLVLSSWKGNIAEKPHCHNGVVDMFGPGWLVFVHFLEEIEDTKKTFLQIWLLNLIINMDAQKTILVVICKVKFVLKKSRYVNFITDYP